MSKNIAISDSVYSLLKREKKKGESFSSVIARMSKENLTIASVAGMKLLGDVAYEDIKKESRKASKLTTRRLENEIA